MPGLSLSKIFLRKNTLAFLPLETLDSTSTLHVEAALKAQKREGVQ